MFLLNYYGNLSFTEIYNFPIGLRRWYIETLASKRKEESEAANKKQ
jgi:hypothetical protein